MRNLRDIRRRIKSVKSTQQITRAMKMVAAARLKKAQDKFNQIRDYSEGIKAVFERMKPFLIHFSKEFFETEEVKKRLVLLVASDKGLCGAYNSKIFEEFLKYGGKTNLEIVAIGTKAMEFLKKNKIEIIKNYSNVFKSLENIPYKEISNLIKERFLSGKVQEVYFLSQRFISLAKMPIIFEKFLPFEFEKDSEIDYIFDPSAKAISEEIIKNYMETKIFQILIEANIAEQFSRMTAMELATKNAEEMIQALTIMYNRMRQTAITKELIEIVSTAQALRRV